MGPCKIVNPYLLSWECIKIHSLFPVNCSIEKEEGPAHERTFVSSVQISTANGVLYMMGDEKSRVRDAENSAASLMIRALQESDFL